MKLSSDLISQFVKATKDTKKETKTETTVYGTVVAKEGDDRYVRFDGANEDTHIDYKNIESTVEADVGDRVIIRIKNHTATIIGNTTPNNRSVGKSTANSVANNVFDERIVDVDYVKTEELLAEAARITLLEADVIKVNNTLIADYVQTKTLEAELAKFDNVYAKTATIEELYAKKADIKNLESDVADIDTLIFGSATGTTIQTEFSNAVIAQLGDAQIKSAMIESISADKITSGDIITNNVRVMSEDGKMLISDETIQISDDTRVRVQIGKDASNDYSINIWDQDGNLMFSEGGITDKAIKDAIIRNDMVSDTANIHASKLDIDSLFEEINDSTNTIKSTQITVDDEGQTLKAKLATLATTKSVDDLSKTVTSQGTAIEANTEAISTKVWQQDIDTAKNEMSTQYSTLEQEIDSISTTVSSHTAEISNKANSSTVTDINSKVTTLEQTLSGFQTTVSETYATQSNLNSLTTNLGTRMSTVEQTATGLTTRITNAENDILDASKTATNYLNFSSGGLVVGDHTADTLGNNVRVTSTGVEVRDGEIVSASFEKDKVTLGRNAEDSVIDLCDGAGKISANTAEAATSYPNRNAILIESQEIETESVRFVASTSNKYDPTSTPAIVRGTELYMQRSSSSAESCARLKAEHKTTSSGAYTNSGVSAMTYDAASTTRLLLYASDSANSTYNNINVYPTKTVMNKNLTLNGTVFTGKNKVLWTGTYYMSDTQTATLSEAISTQANGIVLVWSYYANGAAENSNFQMTYIPKHFITLHPGKGIAASLTNSSMNIMASKYVYVSDTSLKGYAGNDDDAATKNTGVLATSKNFVLRYVIGV